MHSPVVIGCSHPAALATPSPCTDLAHLTVSHGATNQLGDHTTATLRIKTKSANLSSYRLQAGEPSHSHRVHSLRRMMFPGCMAQCSNCISHSLGCTLSESCLPAAFTEQHGLLLVPRVHWAKHCIKPRDGLKPLVTAAAMHPS